MLYEHAVRDYWWKGRPVTLAFWWSGAPERSLKRAGARLVHVAVLLLDSRELSGAKRLHCPDSRGPVVLAAVQEEHVVLTAGLCHPAGVFCHSSHCWVFRDRNCLVIARLAQSLAHWVLKLGLASHSSLQPVNKCMKEDFIEAPEPLAHADLLIQLSPLYERCRIAVERLHPLLWPSQWYWATVKEL